MTPQISPLDSIDVSSNHSEPEPHTKNPSKLIWLLTLALGAASGAVAYGWMAPAPAALSAPLTEVSVISARAQPIEVWSTFSGRMTAVDQADIRPEVSGRITEIHFQDGQQVKAGDIIMVIDPRPYEAAESRAKATLATAQTHASLARLEFSRVARLVESSAVARTVFDQRQAEDKVAQDAVLSAEAELKQARVNLDYAYVKAPISGRISRAEITLGNRVEAGANAPVLTTIVSNDGIYVDFDVDEQTYMTSVRSRAATRDAERQIAVEVLPEGAATAVKGNIFSFDNRVISSSGTIRARAKFKNSDGALIPGVFVAVRMSSQRFNDAILVPDRAIGNDQSKRFVLVVSDDSKVVYRDVVLGPGVDGSHIISRGIKVGDKVIVDGLQQVKPEQKVAWRSADASLAAANTNADSH